MWLKYFGFPTAVCFERVASTLVRRRSRLGAFRASHLRKTTAKQNPLPHQKQKPQRTGRGFDQVVIPEAEQSEAVRDLETPSPHLSP
jgi:hypothetical protein